MWTILLWVVGAAVYVTVGAWLRKLAGRLAVAGKARRIRVEAVTKAAHIAECARQRELQDLEDELAKDAAEA
jgi:hypothetical protein